MLMISLGETISDVKRETLNVHWNRRSGSSFAYEFYEQRGYVDGHDVEDWLVAEQEVRGTLRQRAAA
jgi:Protein of unknown function (DUF2934)